MTDFTGQIIRGYEFIEKIGSGGYGDVYKATEQAVDRPVAVKVIRPEHANQPEFVANFEAEARLVASLEHKDIVPLYTYWQDEHGAFLVMRYVLGGSLRDMMQQQGALPLARTIRILEQVANALHAAHDAGIVHRDLKPDNVLIDERGNAYLTDFGIAKRVSVDGDKSITDQIKGTPAYISPEQIQQQPVTPQTDVYALGVMLYEMLAGQHPFHGASYGEMFMKHLQTSLPVLTDIRPNLPDGINEVIEQATEKNPDDRYPSAPAMLTALCAAPTSANLPTYISGDQPSLPLPTTRPKATNQDDRNRYAMIDNVRGFWVEGVLEQSVHKESMLILGMAEAPEQVDNPWETVLRLPDTPDEPLPPDTRILEMFDRLNGKLLILGEPGSGKTTTLLELTRDLLVRAEQDPYHPIPVVFNLSSWANKRDTLADWMVSELNTKYQVPHKIGEAWITEEKILPLLDGLDEVAKAHRDRCVAAINAYRNEHGFVQMVVCSRTADYAALNNRLVMARAIVLQPLTEEQVNTYLDRLGTSMQGARQVLEDDSKLRQLIQQPVMLNVMTLAYQSLPLDEIPQFDTLEGRRHHLFETYIDRMLERRGKTAKYTADKTRQYLSTIAERMVSDAQSVFLIEDMQPRVWLKYQYDDFIFRCVMLPLTLSLVFSLINFFVLFPGNIIAPLLLPVLLFNLFFSLPGTPPVWLKSFARILLNTIVIFMLVALTYLARAGELNNFVFTVGVVIVLLPVFISGFIILQSTAPSTTWLRSQIVQALLIVSPLFLLQLLVIGVFYGPMNGSIVTMLILPACLLFVVSPYILSVSAQWTEVKPVEKMLWSWRGFVRGGRWSALFIAIMVTMIGLFWVFLETADRTADTSEPIFPHEIYIYNHYYEVYINLENETIMAQRQGILFLPYMYNETWLRNTFPYLSDEVYDKHSALIQEIQEIQDSVRPLLLVVMVTGAVAGFMAGGVLGAIQNSSVNPSIYSNQGLRRSAAFFLVGFPVIFLILYFAIGGFVYVVVALVARVLTESSIYFTAGEFLRWPQAFGIAYVFRTIAENRVIGWVLLLPPVVWAIWLVLRVPLRLGGAVVLLHIALRFQLTLSRILPWNLARFLDHAAEHILLRKVGGGYIFIHRMLLEHFASQATNSSINNEVA